MRDTRAGSDKIHKEGEVQTYIASLAGIPKLDAPSMLQRSLLGKHKSSDLRPHSQYMKGMSNSVSVNMQQLNIDTEDVRSNVSR